MPIDIKLDDERLKKAAWHVTQHTPAVASIHQINDDGKPDPLTTCTVAIVDGMLRFLPERSSAQRRVLARMGIDGGDR